MKSRIILLSFMLAVAAVGCKVTLLPNYDAGIASQIDSTLKMVDKFYLTMLETTKNTNGQRAYQNFAVDYVNIEVELQSLLDKNTVRPLNSDSKKICENTLNQWIKYMSKHKQDDQISDADIILNRVFMHDEIVRIQIGESFKPQ